MTKSIEQYHAEREIYVTKSIEQYRANSVHDDAPWSAERLEAMFAEAFDAAEDGMFEGHSQRDWL